MKEKCVSVVVVCLLLASVNLCSAEIADAGTDQQKISSFKSTPFILKDNRVFIKVSVNGQKPVLFFVDNGWSHTTLDANKSERFAFAPSTKMTFKAMNKKNQTGYLGVVPSLRIGDLEINEPEVRTAKIFNTMSKGLGLRVKGVLGHSSMKRYLTTFNFKNREILFFIDSDDSREMLRQNESLDSLPFGPHPFSGINKQIFSVLIYINDVPVDAIIDIGFNGCILTTLDPKTFKSHLDKGGSKREMSVAGHKGRCYKMKAKCVLFGDKTCEGVKMNYFSTDQSAPQFTLVGVEFLKQFNLTFDYHNQVLFVESVSN